MPISRWGSTNSMAIDRRQFVLGSLVALGQARQVFAAEATAPPDGTVYASAIRRPDGSHAVVVVAEDGRILREIALEARAHDIAIDHDRRRAVVFARRPGFFALAFDVDGRAPPHLFAPRPDRHFYGHGIFASDGRLLYATEHDVDSGHGIIGIYETAGWQRVGEFPSFGIGPHEAILLSDGVTLAVANGGYGNDPETGRDSVGVADMAPNVAFIDVRTGKLKASQGTPKAINLLSVRHLAEAANGDVWFGCQWQGGLEDTPQLLGRVGLDRPLTLLDREKPHGIALRGYIGAVATSGDGRLIAASAPLAGRVVYIDTETGAFVHEVAIADSSGVTPGSGRSMFAMSTGDGAMRLESASGSKPKILSFSGVEFDNHLRRV